MRIRSFVPVVIAGVALSACSESSTGPEEELEVPSFTVNADADWGYASFDGDAVSGVEVSNPSGSTDWHIGFYRTAVSLNGGAAGPGDVEGYCLCQNDGATDEDLLAMTSESELPDFEAVTAADIPADGGAWASDALVPAIDGWYSYDTQTHTVSAAPENTWYVVTADGDADAKLHVTEIAGATQAHAGEVTLEFALMPEGTDEFGAAETLTADLSGGPVYIDLDDGSTSSGAEAGWDVQLSGFDLLLNGGASGDGQAAAAFTTEPFGEIVDTSGTVSQAYVQDAFGGVFDEHPWYAYDLENNHRIWPTFNVYLIRTGASVYKLQLTSYYSSTGQSRHISFRYELLE